jgi:hypothetical protein
LTSATHVDAEPPSLDDCRTRRRDALLEACIPDTVKGLTRMAKLKTLITSDIHDEEIVVYHRGPFDLQKWASELSWELLPAKVKLFQRRRWMSSAGPLKECLLQDSCFKLLSRAVPLWIDKLSGKTSKPAKQSSWEPDESDDDPVGNPAVVVLADLAEPGRGVSANETDYVQWNLKQRGDAKRFAESRPGPVLLVALCSHN